MKIYLSIVLICFCVKLGVGQVTAATAIYEKSIPAVVLITVANERGEVGLGSGVILRADGIIATNYHVIRGATQARVKLRNGDIYDDVTVLDTDPRKDIAIIKIKATNLPFLPTSDSDSLKVGANIYVIGAPEGLEGTLSSGMISSIRPADEIDPKLSGFRVIQFTAPISHGSSGSPLLNDKGEVIGLAKGAREDGQNLNIGIPSNYFSPLVSSPKIQGQELAQLSDRSSANQANAPSEKAPDPLEIPPLPSSTAALSTSSEKKMTGTVEDIVGLYSGRWGSRSYDAGGQAFLIIRFDNGTPNVAIQLTGSEYFSRDTLDATFTQIAPGTWQMVFKAKKNNLKGEGIFKNGRFIGGYKFKKFIWTDIGDWTLDQSSN